MQKRLLWVLALVSLLGSSLTYARSAELVDPKPINVTNIPFEKIESIIGASLVQKGWVKKKFISEQPRIIEIEFAIRTHRILMQLEYDTTNIKLSYANSENLNYENKKGKKYIHPNYIQWTQALADQISANISSGGISDLTTSPTSAAASTTTNFKNPSTPTEAFHNFSSFKLEKTTLGKKYNTVAGNISSARNLDASIEQSLKSKLNTWTDASKPARTLTIKPHIEAVRFIGSGARFFVGAMAGRSWMYVKLTCVDEASGAIISETEFYRVAQMANGFTLARADYKMVEDLGDDIVRFMENNYNNAIGGGSAPPQDVRVEAAQ